MKAFGGVPAIYNVDPYKETSVQYHQLGAIAETGDGRKFRYSWMGEEITVGRLATAGAINTSLANMAVISGAAGSKKINFTNAATTTTAKYFDEGYAIISYATGGGQIFKIDSLPALVSAASSWVYLEDPIVTALDTTSKLDLVQHPNSQVLMTATATLEPVGVSLITFTTQYYGWLQTHGVATVHMDATVAAGTNFFNDGSEAGAVDVGTEAGWVVNPTAGRAYQIAGADEYWTPVFLTID
jgi:hypothetical protein